MPDPSRRATAIKEKKAKKYKPPIDKTEIYARLFSVVCVALILLHGFEGWKFRVDTLTILLLMLAGLPYIRTVFTGFKFGGMEAQFRDLPMYKQIFLFLDGIIANDAWTFYIPRTHEAALGLGFARLIDWAVEHRRADLVEHVAGWLKGDSENRRWFAAEVVGYKKLDELEGNVEETIRKKAMTERWEKWELNCLWAYSRLNHYAPLVERLEETRNSPNNTPAATNRKWLLGACIQMLHENAKTDARMTKHVPDSAEDIRLLIATLESYDAGMVNDCERELPATARNGSWRDIVRADQPAEVQRAS